MYCKNYTIYTEMFGPPKFLVNFKLIIWKKQFYTNSMKAQKKKVAVLTGTCYFPVCITGWNPFFTYKSDSDIPCWS